MLNEFQNVGENNFIPFQTTHTHYVYIESKLLKDMRFKYLFGVFQCTFGRNSSVFFCCTKYVLMTIRVNFKIILIVIW